MLPYFRLRVSYLMVLPYEHWKDIACFKPKKSRPVKEDAVAMVANRVARVEG